MRFTGLRLVLLVLLSSVACQPFDPSNMIAIPPPQAWESDLLEQRAGKDDYFRRSPESPLLPEEVAGFPGLDYWEPDERFYFIGPINRYAEPEKFDIITTTGQQRPCERYGWMRFPMAGAQRTLQVYRLLDSQPRNEVDSLLVAFTDETSGHETYPAGRYVDLQGPAGGPYVLDFNKAYNPSCAYGDAQRFACPRAPAENRLAVGVEVGERGFHRADASPAEAGS